MKVVKNKSSMTLEQHQKAMSALEKRLAKANAKLARVQAKAEKERQQAQDKLERERQKAQTKLDKQRKKDQEAVAKRVAKFEDEKAKETQQRERKEQLQWEKQIRQEEKRRTKLRDSRSWKGSKKLGKSRQKLKNQLIKIFKQQENEIKSLEKAYKKFQSKKFKDISESWDAEIKAEEEMRQWDEDIREEEERRKEPFDVTKIRENSNERFTTYFDVYEVTINRPPVDPVDVVRRALRMTINERGLVPGDKIRLIVSHPSWSKPFSTKLLTITADEGFMYSLLKAVLEFVEYMNEELLFQ